MLVIYFPRLNMKYLFILLLVWSCATHKKSAIKLSEQGLHEAAIPMWLEALKEDPKDSEAQVGFLISQEKVMNERLVKIRDLRIANNKDEALLELKVLIELQASWKTQLDFNSSSFQGKEVKELWVFQKQSVNALLKKGFPLAAEYQTKKYKIIFNSMTDFGEMKIKINSEGQKKCNSLNSVGSSEYYFKSFVMQFCKYFDPGRNISSISQNPFYSHVKIKGSIKNVPVDLVSGLEEKLTTLFKDTPWYKAEGQKALVVELKGEYHWVPKTQVIPQVHTYNVQIPYTAYVPVMKTRQIPYQASEYTCVYNAYTGNTCGNISVTRYRPEFYWENEAITKYRNEARAFDYFAKKNTQDLILVLKGNVGLEKQIMPFTFSKHEKEQRIVHDLNMPEIGLYPARTDISSPIEKFSEYSHNISEKFKEDVVYVWTKTYCTTPRARDIASTGEYSIRCMKAPDFSKEFVDPWFENNLGVTSDESIELLGHF